MKLFFVALLSLLATTAFLFVTHSLQPNATPENSVQVQNVDILSLAGVRDDNHVDTMLLGSANGSEKIAELSATNNEKIISTQSLSASDVNNTALFVSMPVYVEPTPDNADMPATGEFADQVNLTPLPCHSDCADDWDEFAPAIGEYSDQVNLAPLSTENALPDDVDMDTQPSTVTGSYIES